MFDEVCQQFRSKWLEERAMADADGVQALDVVEGHQSACNACRGWVRSTKQQISLLMELPLLDAPEELDAKVEHAIEHPPADERVEEILAALPRKPAPQELEQRLVESMKRDSERRREQRVQTGEDRTVQSVRTLDIEPVPHVLERLVDEEIGAPAAHRADRMAGNLEPQHAPEALTRRVARQLARQDLPRIAKLVGAPAAALLAACLLLWIALRGGGEEAPGYSFEIVRAQDTSALNPVARQVADALSAGTASAVREYQEEGK